MLQFPQVDIFHASLDSSITSAKLGRSQPRDAAIQQAAQGVPILFDNFDEFQLSLFHLLKSFIRAAVLKFHDPGLQTMNASRCRTFALRSSISFQDPHLIHLIVQFLSLLRDRRTGWGHIHRLQLTCSTACAGPRQFI